MPQQLLANSERFVEVSDQSSTDWTWTIAMVQANDCRVFLDRPHTTSKNPHIRSPETFICARNRNLYKQPSGRTNRRPNGRSPVGPLGQRPFQLRCFSPPNGSQEQRRTSLTRQSDSRSYRRQNNGFRTGFQPRRPMRAQNGPTAQA